MTIYHQMIEEVLKSFDKPKKRKRKFYALAPLDALNKGFEAIANFITGE